MIHVLVLSAHQELDRRITAEINTLVESGRRVTLVTVPARVPAGCLDPAVRVIGGLDERAPPAAPGKPGWRGRLARRLPPPLSRLARSCWRHLQGRHADRYFLRRTPPGPYDAIHCHDLHTLPAALAIRRHLTPGARLIYDSHELFPFQDDDPELQRYWSRVEARSIRGADRVITVNESIARELVRLYGIERPAVLFNSVAAFGDDPPLPAEQFFQRFQARPGGFNVLFQGSLSLYRNTLNLVRAFALLGNPYRLFVIGAGPFEGPMRRVRDESRADNVYFGGWVEQRDLMRYTPHADLGVIPYEAKPGVLNMTYCTPNKLFEFIEARVPVCGSDLPEIARIVTGHGIGGVYPMQSPDEIAHAVKDCAARCQRGEFPLTAREAARETFSWQKQGEKLLALYESLGV